MNKTKRIPVKVTMVNGEVFEGLITGYPHKWITMTTKDKDSITINERHIVHVEGKFEAKERVKYK